MLLVTLSGNDVPGDAGAVPRQGVQPRGAAGAVAAARAGRGPRLSALRRHRRPGELARRRAQAGPTPRSLHVSSFITITTSEPCAGPEE